MTSLKRSICHHLFDTYGAADLRATFDDLAGLGFDAVELLGEPTFYPAETAALVRSSGLTVTGLTAASRVSTGRDLTHYDPLVRARTREHLQKCVEFAQDIECSVVGVALTAVGRFRRDGDEAAEVGRIAEALDWLDQVANEAGVVFSIEVLNRYSSAYLNSPDADAEIGWRRPNVKLTLDTFHLLTELRSVEDIRAWAQDTANVQVSGGARGTVGLSLVDPGVFVAELAGGGYRGPVTLEAFPAGTAAFSDTENDDRALVIDIARDFIAWCDRWDREWHARANATDAVSLQAM